MRKPLIILIILAFVGLSGASFISLTPSIDNENIVSGNESILTFSLSNSGDEPAYDVVASLFLPVGMRAEDLFAGRLDDNSSYSGRFRISLDDDILPGAYSNPLLVDYKDANGHPFSAVYSFSQVVRQAAFSKVTPRFNDLQITDKGGGDLKLSLRNLDEKAHQVKVKFFLPRELRSDADEKTVSVSEKSDSEIVFSVSSFDALAGSSYAVFAVVSYEEDGVHYSTYSSGIVKVVAEKPLPDWIPSWLPLAVLAGLILVVIVYQLKK
jgi:hypothetical protein